MEKTTENQLEKAVKDAKIDLENPNYYGTCTNQDGSANVEVPARPLHLFTASAGSGKTWRLAFEYICLLLKDAYLPSENKKNECIPDNYRHILAITFTNKATSEMKDRILVNLELLLNESLTDEKSKKERDTYLSQLSARLSIPTETVVGRAELVYSNLLHDYSHFHIQTIDSFFQSVLRNLAQELGIGSYWEVELNSEEVLKEAAHRLLNNVRNDKNLLNWVSKYVQEKLDDNKNWNIEGELVSFGANLFSEALVTNDEMGYFLTDDPQNPTLRKRIRLIKEAVAESRKMVLENIKFAAANAVAFCDTHDIPADHFATKGAAKNLIYNYLADISRDVARNWSNSLTNFVMAETADEMDKIAFPKAHQGKHLDRIAELQGFVKTIRDENYRIVVFNQVLKNINQIGLLSDIKNEVTALQEEQNIFMLAYAQPLLHKFITNEDAPFVFERIGESLHYMMIDEFQDTSKVQYQNFRPLIHNCCSSYKGSLIVGDAKQAIYRFRNGDWTLIESLRKQAKGEKESNANLVMPDGIQDHDMQFNYRSLPNVVDFNNAVFRAEFSDEKDPSYPLPLNKSIVSLLDSANAGHTEYLKQVYSTSHQFAQKYEGGEKNGYVKVKFHQISDSDSNSDDDEATPWTLNALLAEINDAYNKGVAYSDMTILSRFNKDIPKIADFLTDNGLEVVSDLAFLLRASNKVRLIIDALRYVDAYVSKTSSHPKDELYKKQLSCDYLRFLNSTEAESYDFNGSVEQLEHWCQMLRGELNLDGKSVTDLLAKNAGETDVLPSLPVYDMAEEIYHLLFPDLPTDEYVQAFFDYLRDFVARRVVTVRDVLNYWDDKLSGISIPADSKKNSGIKIMSVHKSKGLESHTIFLANCSWKATTDRHSSFWCSGIGKLGEDMGDFEIPMLPIDFSSDLEGTTFDNEYWEEMAQLHAENVNLFYVALTRAEKNLVVIDEYSIPKKEPKDDSKFLNAKMGRLLFELFDEGLLQKDDVPTLDDDSEMCYILGKTVPSKQVGNDKKNSAALETVSKQDTFPIRGRFRQSSEANSFILNKAITTSASADFGIQMHSLLAFIMCLHDCNNPQPEIHKAVGRLILEGVISADASAEFEKDAIRYFKVLAEKGSYLQEWFNPLLKVYNEEGIILYDDWTKRLEEKRPDRMVYDAETNTFTIVDYKTGHFSASLFAKHAEQVQTYMKLAKQLSPNAKVRGYVWYLTANRVESVI